MQILEQIKIYLMTLFLISKGENMIDKELLAILACPVCKESVKLAADKLICAKCGRRYSIQDDIPIMLADEAQTGKTAE